MVAVLGLGEAGARLAGDLVSRGAEVRGFDPRTTGPDGVQRADDPARAVAGAAVVLSLTTASTALAAAESALPCLGTGAI